MKAADLLKALGDLVFPPRETCPLCGVGSPGAKICAACMDWVRAHENMPMCPVCGRFIITGEDSGRRYRDFCSFCRAQRPSFSLARAVAPYRGRLRDALLQVKRRGTGPMTMALAGLAAAVARREREFARAGLIIPVPMSPGRFKEKGFNHAALLAAEVGRMLCLPVDNRVISKTRETKRQTGLQREERLSNLQGSFRVEAPEKIRGKRILIFDDILTSGATMEIIANELRQHSAGDVFALTVAGGVVATACDTKGLRELQN